MWAREPKAKGRTVIFSDNSCSRDMYQVLGEGVFWSMNDPWSDSLHWHLKILEGEKDIQGREKWSGKNRDATEQGAGQGHAVDVTEVWVRKSGFTEGCEKEAGVVEAELSFLERLLWTRGWAEGFPYSLLESPRQSSKRALVTTILQARKQAEGMRRSL